MMKKDIYTWIALAAIIILAAFFRLYDIQNYPPGLFPDEAANGEDVQLILDGDIRPFYERGNGREALFFYLQAASVWLFGIGVWQMHVVSGAVGIATVAASFFATRPYFGRLAGLLAAFFLATSHWHVTLSRTGFRAIMIPLFVALFTAFVGYTITAAKSSKQAAWKSYLFAALAGASFAGGFYTYIAYRVMIGVVGGIVLLLLLAAIHPKIGFPHFRRYGRQIAVGIVAAIIVFAPLGWYFIQQPEAIVGRAGQVSVFSPDLQQKYGGGTLAGTLLFSTRETLASFFVGDGDLNWRHNVAGYPLLNAIVGILFLLGLMWAIHGTVAVVLKVFKGEEVHLGMIYPYLLLLLFGMLLPVITTAEGIPHGLRSIGLIAPIFILAGTAAAVCIHWLQVRAKNETGRMALYGVVVGVLVLGALYDGALYFFIARNDSAAHYSYRADLTDVAAFINNDREENPQSARPYLVLDKFSIQTVHFLASVSAHDFRDHPDELQHKYHYLDPATSHLTPPEAGRLIIFTQSTFPDADRYEERHGALIELVESRRNRFGQEIMRVYRGTEDAGPGATPSGEEEFNLDA